MKYKFHVTYANVADEDGRCKLSTLFEVEMPTPWEAIVFARALKNSIDVESVHERNGLDFSYPTRCAPLPNDKVRGGDDE